MTVSFLRGGGTRGSSGLPTVVERLGPPPQKSHARPNSRQTIYRTYKAGYRDSNHLWSRC